LRVGKQLSYASFTLYTHTKTKIQMQRHCLTLDLKNDPRLISEYEAYHRAVWPDIIKSIRDAGVRNLEIYRFDNRLCMILEADDQFTFEKKSAMDSANQTVQKWEALMWTYQQALPLAKPGEKWMVMEKIFQL
jgi:L-rhamnose mutarotase